MRLAICHALLMFVLTSATPGVSAQTPPRQNSGRETWYEFMLKQFNPSNFDYGTWLEKRRRAFLEATVKKPYFWYSVSATAGILLMMAICTKFYLDHRRSMQVTAEMMADMYSHDAFSRQAAAEAIERYNQHIERCNRAIEASEAGDARPGWGETQADSLKSELQRVASQLEATTQERNKLQEELRQKSLIVADLSTRLDALSKKLNGPRNGRRDAGESEATDASASGTRFVGHINRLQEELYTERQKTKRLKGA